MTFHYHVRRGEILDRNGIILAKSDMVYNVVLDCKAINQDEDYVEPTIRALEDVFGVDAPINAFFVSSGHPGR